MRIELTEIFDSLKRNLKDSSRVDEIVEILSVRPSVMPLIKKQYRMVMIAVLDDLLQRWEDFIDCVKIGSDKDIYYAVTYKSSVKDCVRTKLSDFGITYCVVQLLSGTLKLQGKVSENNFNDLVKGLILEMFGFEMSNVSTVFIYSGDCDMPVGELDAL